LRELTTLLAANQKQQFGCLTTMYEVQKLCEMIKWRGKLHRVVMVPQPSFEPSADAHCFKLKAPVVSVLAAPDIRIPAEHSCRKENRDTLMGQLERLFECKERLLSVVQSVRTAGRPCRSVHPNVSFARLLNGFRLNLVLGGPH
jgi:hypothetical protein